jgi:type IV pilus assembly protein PilC
MSNYSYVAVDPKGAEMRGTLMVSSQSEALQRIKEMGLYPTRLLEQRERIKPGTQRAVAAQRSRATRQPLPWLRGRIRPAALAVFTRQLATLIEAGMPLVRGLRILHQQEANHVLKRTVGELALAIENGCSLTEALEAHPRVFNRLYVNMVKAGEIGGAVELTLQRLAEFMEKARRIKGRVTAALFYPAAVLTVAAAIMAVMMIFVIPRFKTVFEGLLNGQPLPAFTRFVLGLSELVQHHVFSVLSFCALFAVAWAFGIRTTCGRQAFDRVKLALPVLGPLFRKAAISRVTRTLGTLVSSGVPILQALTIVQETAGNLRISRVMAQVHDRVKEGDPIAPTLKSCSLFPAIVAGMVDVGEQTGALPEMLMKIADNYDEEVDNAANAMTALLEPILIVFLAVIVGSLVIAMLLPLVRIMDFDLTNPNPERGAAN